MALSYLKEMLSAWMSAGCYCLVEYQLVTLWLKKMKLIQVESNDTL